MGEFYGDMNYISIAVKKPLVTESSQFLLK